MIEIVRTQEDVKQMLALLAKNPFARYEPGGYRDALIDALRYYRYTGKLPSDVRGGNKRVLLDVTKWLHGYPSPLDEYTEEPEA